MVYNIRFFPHLMLIFLTGCTGLPRDQVQIALPDDCPNLSAVSLVEEQNQLGPLTDTHTLACALTVLRNTQDPAVLGTSLGSRLSLLLAEREVDQNKREKLAAEGVGFAEAALQRGGRGDGAVHYYLAANLGLSVREHITLAMRNLGRLEDEMKQAVALNPDIDSGGPLRLLGMLYLKAPSWPNGIGDIDKALELLEKAAREHPDHPLNHLFYARALWAEGDEANLTQIKAELAQAEKLLEEGDWGYNKNSWKNEFAEFAQEFKPVD
ncbi:MAG: tetratricopeptide repeat protein [Methylicorpusculum sp.]|uniref:sterol transporter outer membrane protein BstC n=2 Tax=Methylicorpusculum sp. TaxID=2713644 RepID=UPI00271E283C|nr:sterol transporter outer membrane protein BstC [Methylicorpusculum sp.]MDO8940358.1 tetratricopeptide repeat protein [Methylicorpusculum sp.]MDP2203881.1 tetratricopeptide repeat protein [Methylicorpusculum sp.]